MALAAIGSVNMNGSEVRKVGRAWRDRIERDPLAARVVSALWDDRTSYAAPIMQRARRESPIMDAVFETDLQEVRKHVLAHFDALLSLPTERALDLGEDPLEFVRVHGVRRARNRVPLRAVLQAYRTGHKSFWAAMCDKLNMFSDDPESILKTTMLLSDYLIEYTDLISIAVTDAYTAEERLLEAHRTRLSIGVLEGLLLGHSPIEKEGMELLEHAGILSGRSMVSFVVRRSNAESFGSEERGNLVWRLHALVGETLGRLIDLRGNEIAGVVSCTDDAGASLLRTLLAALKSEQLLLDSKTRIGIGLNVSQIGEIPRSYAEAVTASELGGAESPVLHLAEISVDAYLRHRADTTAQMLAPAWCLELRDSELELTLSAFAQASLNIKRCAHLLKLHNNTIYHRLNRIQRITGIDPRSYDGLCRLLAALSVSSKRAHSAN